MKKCLFITSGYMLFVLLLTSCEIDESGNMTMSNAGWIFLACLVVAFIVGIAHGNNTKNDEEQKELERKIQLNKSLKEYQEQREKKEQAYKEKYAAIAEEYKDCDFMDIDVKGIFARSWKARDLVPVLNVEDEIKLRKEPKNAYDPYAVKVMSDRIHLGYVPGDVSQFVTGLIDEKRIRKVVVKFAGESQLEPWDKPDPYLILTIYFEKELNK